MKQALSLILTVHAVAAVLSLIIILGGFQANIDPEHVKEIGGTLTLVLLLFAIAAHLKARLGQFVPALAALVAVPGPVYAFLAGPWNHVLGYHVFAAGIHGFILYHLRRLERADHGQEKDS